MRNKVVLAVVFLLWMGLAWADTPQLINFQGRLTDSLGNPVSNGAYSLRFRIYDDSLAGNILWEETDPVQVKSGLFTVLLGSTNSIPDSAFYSANRWLGIKIGTNPEITPRQRLASVGYSYVSSQWNSADSNLYRIKGKVGIGTSTPAFAKLEVVASSGIGVFASGSPGVYCPSSSGTGVFGEGSLYGLYGNSNGTGVFGTGPQYGVHGDGYNGTGVYGSGVTYGVYGVASANNGSGVYGSNGGNPSTYAGYFVGTVYVAGDFYAVGTTKSAAVKGNNGEYRVPYAQESPENWFEDFGTAQLVNGQATVNIDPLYAQTVNTAVTYYVFLTPEGDCQGLFVTGKTPACFEVRELQNGKSNLSVSYRIVAKRKGYENVRLPKLPGLTPEEVQAKDVKLRAEMAKENAGHLEEQARMEQERKKMEEERTKMEQECLLPKR